MIAERLAVLASPRTSPEKSAIARALCERAAQRAAADRPAIHRRAARTGRALVQAARRSASGEEAATLCLFAGACRTLLASAVPVRNFDRPGAHALFALVEGSFLDHLAGDLQALHPAAVGKARALDLRSAARLGAEPEALHACTIPLAIAQRPVAMLPELLGFACAGARVVAALSRGSPGRGLYLATWRSLRRAAEASDPEGTRRGAAMLERCLGLLAAAADRSAPRIRRRAARILEEKARYAMLHHRDEVLAGRRLVEWFSDKPFRAGAMLDALHASAWIDRDDVERSRFFRSLTGRGGRMEGVFDAAEIDVLKQHFGGAAPVDGAEAIDDPDLDLVAAAPPGDAPAAHDHVARYFHLLDGEERAGAGEVAAAVVDETLAELASLRRAPPSSPLFLSFPYRRADVEERVSRIYWYQAERIRALELSLDAGELRTFHLHFAPLALVDGCWLRGAVAAGRAGGLARVYADEIGNGEHAHNHANLYGRLMGQLGWDISSVNDERLRAAPIPALAYKAPAFLLALDLVHADRAPELLGVTLAIEMSGLDGLYERMIALLEAQRIDASYWRLHVSVDNLSTGHARQSLDAVLDFMDEAEGRYGAALAGPVWERIWTGFLVMLYLFEVELRVLVGRRSAA